MTNPGQSNIRCIDLAESALDRRTADNGQSRADWCAGVGLDPMDVALTAGLYFGEQVDVYMGKGEEREQAFKLALADIFLYGILLGRELR